MRIAAVVKAVAPLDPASPDGGGGPGRPGALTLNPFCRRAVAQACELAAAVGDGTVTVVCLGPPDAAEVVRDAAASGRTMDVDCDGVLLSDPVLEGCDTLATARALAGAVDALGGFDLVLAGRSAVDVDTGQVGPQLAELLGWPFAGGARYLSLHRDTLRVRGERDDGWAQLDVELPAVVSCAERLIDPGPTLSSPSGPRPRRLDAGALGPGPWGREASAVRVEAVARRVVARQRARLDGPPEDQVDRAVATLRERGALADPTAPGRADVVPPGQGERGDAVAVLVEPTRDRSSRQVLALAARLALDVDGHVVALTVAPPDPPTLGSWGADAVVHLEGSALAEDVGGALADWVRVASPWAVLAPSTTWGREVMARAAARLGVGLIGGAAAVAVDGAGRLRVEAPVLGGERLALLTSASAVQLVTVRPGALGTPAGRASGAVTARAMAVAARSRLRLRSEVRDDDLEALANAPVVVGVGLGVPHDDYPTLGPLLAALGAELGATRSVVDRGWLPHARQIGLTGRSVAPRLYVALGVAGGRSHLAAVSGAQTVLAVHGAADAPVFESADVGIVGDWRDVVPRLAVALSAPGVAGR